ncbi:hypothetical protein NMS_0750 [Nonlabens marinus S1-08]|uniref:Uncharacterized protein n=1 Tax=Nonlabens marinus S1-08 TaxID=1454201 RepID=W8VP07_9FLAO|nr:hypothetical protein NMS_0750 [Nonlabens marinus S1-08]
MIMIRAFPQTLANAQDCGRALRYNLLKQKKLQKDLHCNP